MGDILRPFRKCHCLQDTFTHLQVIGGNQDGNADIRAPVNGFSQQDLGTLLGVAQPNNSSTIAPKRSNGRSNLGKGAIVGIILAAVAWHRNCHLGSLLHDLATQTLST